ncbi:MAG TPA: hypothetical protein VGA92_06470 [Candidatus Nitrosotenuis sp.]
MEKTSIIDSEFVTSKFSIRTTVGNVLNIIFRKKPATIPLDLATDHHLIEASEKASESTKSRLQLHDDDKIP